MPWIFSERQSCSVMSMHSPSSRGVPHPRCVLGTLPCGDTPVFQLCQGLAAAARSEIQPCNPCSFPVPSKVLVIAGF